MLHGAPIRQAKIAVKRYFLAVKLCGVEIGDVKTWRIQPNFKIPKGYRRRFVFSDETGKFQEELIVDWRGVEMKTTGEASGRTQSWCLDWIEESLMSVRIELGAI